MSYSDNPATPTIRVCDRPGCAERYDALAVMDGTAKDFRPGWRGAYLMMHMCPDDSWLWVGPDGTDGPHRPRLDHEHGTGTTRCSCGTQITTVQTSLGDTAAAYVRHLAEVLG